MPKVGQLIYDCTDAQRFVGRVVAINDEFAEVFWHDAYSSPVPIKNLCTDVPSYMTPGEKLGLAS